MKKKVIGLMLGCTLMSVLLSACASNAGDSQSTTETNTTSESEAASTETTPTETALSSEPETETGIYSLNFDNMAWNYNEEDDVYWQIGVVYCENPADTTYESMGIYVPAAYMSAVDNGDGTYTCEISADGTVGGYTAATAPMVMTVNTPGYSAMKAPTEYTSGLADYLDSGFIYIYAGCRGRASLMGGPNAPSETTEAETADSTGSAPWAVTDLKAAIRYLRYNDNVLPGDAERIVTFGMSGGGAQSALVGATGDSALYAPYLETIGAAMTDADGNTISDAIYGAMAWCPITSLDFANEAYEWNMGQYVSNETRADGTFTSALSDDMSAVYAAYINDLRLTSQDGTVLMLEASDNGIYAAGTYYEYMISVVEQSLNNFLSDTTFPYTPDNSSRAGFAGNAGGNDGATTESTETVSYENAQAYIDSLNADETWITYDESSNTASVESMSAFVNTLKNPRKTVGAFDGLDRSQGENEVFGTADNEALHFDAAMASLLADNQEKHAQYSDWNASYPTDFAEDLTYTDAQGVSMADRMNAYNPMYYLDDYYEGYGTSTVAPHWRIRTGINQSDTALTVETNLALALEQYEDVSVDFATVWGLQHTTAERTGDATTNFVEWVNEICQ